MSAIRMARAHAVRLAIGLRLIDRSLPELPTNAIRKMRKGAQTVAIAANHTDDLPEIISAAESVEFDRSGIESFLRECLFASLEYEPDMTDGLKPPAPAPAELYAAALGVLA